jgi:hypothetical protein
MRSYFDADDVNYLAVNYNLKTLRFLLRPSGVPVNHLFDYQRWDERKPWIEFSGAGIEARLSAAWTSGDLAMVTFYDDLKETVGLAISVRRFMESVRRRRAAFPDQRLDAGEVKSQADIVEVASRYTNLKKAGRNFTGLCPFHSEKHGSFFVFPEKQTWHCFGACNTGGDVIALVMKAENCDFKTALTALGDR